MYKLNNRGWGYFPFLLILLLLLSLLLLVAYLINNFNQKFPNDGYRINLTIEKNNLLE